MNLNLNLNLKKRLVFLKVATTGFQSVDKKDAPGDRIIEISIIKVDVDRTVKSHTKLLNPGIPIPESASKVNGITNEMVANAPAFAEIANGLYTFIGDADLAGFGISNFDVKFLTEEFNRAKLPFTIVNRSIVDTSSMFNVMEKRDFRAAAEKFAGTTLSDEPISSETSNNISAQILNGMIKNYSEDSRFQNSQPETLHKSFNKNKNSLDVNSKIIINKDGRPVINFGKYIGLLVADTMLAETNYYDWCLNVSDLAGDTKLLIKMITEKARAAQTQNTQNA